MPSGAHADGEAEEVVDVRRVGPEARQWARPAIARDRQHDQTWVARASGRRTSSPTTPSSRGPGSPPPRRLAPARRPKRDTAALVGHVDAGTAQAAGHAGEQCRRPDYRMARRPAAARARRRRAGPPGGPVTRSSRRRRPAPPASRRRCSRRQRSRTRGRGHRSGAAAGLGLDETISPPPLQAPVPSGPDRARRPARCPPPAGAPISGRRSAEATEMKGAPGNAEPIRCPGARGSMKKPRPPAGGPARTAAGVCVSAQGKPAACPGHDELRARSASRAGRR